MTRDEVIQMAVDAGFKWPEIHTTTPEERLERFAKLVAAAEREACAMVCDEVECGAGMMIEERHTANECAKKIRARGEV
jgi:hypothetical protein